MTKRVYRSAQGKPVDVDKLRLENEDVIAVGNMPTNARGDELGKGGTVVRTRDQVMKDYYKLKTPVASGSHPRSDDSDDGDFDPTATPVEPPKKQTKKKGE